MTRKIFYERDLPHWQPPGATFFLTYRLAGSIPVVLLNKLRQELAERQQELDEIPADDVLSTKIEQYQRWSFGQLEALLDRTSSGPTWLANPPIAQLIADSWSHCGERYVDLSAYTIMPNHVHALVKHRPEAPLLCKILQQHKGFTGRHANQLLGRHGPFWQRETSDHIVRNEQEFQRILQYILQNPVKAGFVKNWSDWPWTFVHPNCKR